MSRPTCPLLGGELTADYAVRLRYFSDFDEINTTSHLLNAGLEVPLGTRTIVRARDHFATGVLESTEVDPGQEYFFNLSPFKRNEVEVGARVETGSRMFVDGEVGYNDVRFDEPGSFFPYTESRARVGVGTTFGDNLRAGVYYSYFRVPPPDTRPVVESTSHSVGIGLEGDLGSLTRGTVQLDWRQQDSPGAAPGGQSYSGLAGSLSLSRELSPSSRVGARSAGEPPTSRPSRATPSTSLPAGRCCSRSASPGRSPPTAPSATRRTTTRPWPRPSACPAKTRSSAGPPVSRGRWEASATSAPTTGTTRRRSNLPGYDITTDGFIVQMGVGLFGSSVRR